MRRTGATTASKHKSYRNSRRRPFTVGDYVVWPPAAASKPNISYIHLSLLDSQVPNEAGTIRLASFPLFALISMSFSISLSNGFSSIGNGSMQVKNYILTLSPET